MGDPNKVPLPEFVEEMLAKLCIGHGVDPPDNFVRRRLGSVGKESALQILQDISKSPKVWNLSAYINFMIKKHNESSPVVSAESSSSLSSSPQRSGETSFSPVSRRQTLSPSTAVMRRSPLFDEHTSPLLIRHDEAESRQSSITDEKVRENSSPQLLSSQLLALSRLEFPKFFLLLSYIGDEKLEDVFTSADVQDVLKFKDAPWGTFESYVWNIYGERFLDESDRLQYVDWDSGNTHLYYCYLKSDGSRTFKGPYYNTTGTHLQRKLGDENVLIVKFQQCGTYCSSIVKEGILVGHRRFRFFVYKDGGRKKMKRAVKTMPDAFVKCYFVCTENLSPCNGGESCILNGKTVYDARCLFMHVHTVSSMAKYMARFSLILSKTVNLQIDFASVHIQTIDDIPCIDEKGSIIHDGDEKPLILTDGAGYISEDLAKKCPRNFYKAKHVKSVNYENDFGSLGVNGKSIETTQSLEAPLIMQCRLFHNGQAMKGTLLLNRKLPPGTIQIRPSMIKVEADLRLSSLQALNSLEIVAISHKPKKTNLSKNLIALLSYGGVPREFFMDLLKNALQEAHHVYTNAYAALEVAECYAERKEAAMAKTMLWADIPLNEPYLDRCLSSMSKDEWKGLKEGRIPIEDTYNLIGTVDPTGTLDYDQVCIILEHGQMSGKVLVYRHPGLHFGDIHVLTAVYVKAIEDIVGNAKYAIFFSARGQRSIASEFANGDYDGDKYWVSTNCKLLEYFKGSNAWERICSTDNKVSHKKPNELSADELEQVIFQQFLDGMIPSCKMGIAADSWLSFMDQLLTMGQNNAKERKKLKLKMHKLTDIYYDTLDAPKSGKQVEIPCELIASKYPHYMEKDERSSYHSNSVLGHIYDYVSVFSQNQEQQAPDIWKLPCFEVDIPEDYWSSWRERYDEYLKIIEDANVETIEAMKPDFNTTCDSEAEMVRKYKEMLYGAEEFHKSTRSIKDIYNEALVIYHLSYDDAENRGEGKRCGFAWRVAGQALCNLYIMRQGERPMVCSPSALRKIIR